MCCPAGPAPWREECGMKKHNLSLGLRTARNLVLLAAVLALGAALLFAPRWMMEGRLRAAMRSDGLTGQGELLWRGEVAGLYDGGMDYMIVLEEDGRLYAGRLESYEGRPYICVLRGEEAEAYRTPGGELDETGT